MGLCLSLNAMAGINLHGGGPAIPLGPSIQPQPAIPLWPSDKTLTIGHVCLDAPKGITGSGDGTYQVASAYMLMQSGEYFNGGVGGGEGVSNPGDRNCISTEEQGHGNDFNVIWLTPDSEEANKHIYVNVKCPPPPGYSGLKPTGWLNKKNSPVTVFYKIVSSDPDSSDNRISCVVERVAPTFNPPL